MTTENLKAVLTEEELGRVSHVTMIAEGAKSESPKTFSGCIVCFFYHTVLEILSIIARLADEVARLRDTPNNNDHFYMDGHSVGLAQNENRVKELEAQVTALKKLDDDNNADSVRRLKQMEEDKRTINELENALHEVKEREVREIERTIVAEAKLKAWEDAPMVEVTGQALVDYTGDFALDGTYHLKPKEADDEVV